ncbi:MAG: IS3 family transposase [Sedimentisphaerales bacterium]|nr:IS3 family transposase [Sedimentisphaerales bacterium]
MKYAWIQKHTRLFPVALMCRVLKASASGYYDSLKCLPCQQLVRRKTIAQTAVAHSYFESNRIYGYRKVYQDLQEENIVCCQETVRRIMRRIGLYSRIKRKFFVTTDSNHIFKYIEVFYNRKHRHASQGHVSPAVYEEMHEIKQDRAA